MENIMAWSVKSASLIYTISQVCTFVAATVTAVCVLSMWKASDILGKDSDLRIEEAKAQAAQANERAEKIKKTIKWREVSQEQYEKLKYTIMKKPSFVIILTSSDDPESIYYAKSIENALIELGIEVGRFYFIGSQETSSDIEVYSDDATLSAYYKSIFEGANFNVAFSERTPWAEKVGRGAAFTSGVGGLAIVVGPRLPPGFQD
ncbi:hypothetical protein JRX38_14300 [Gluconobacter cerinus]|uniref:hypothetical protein n=1 Tax=Gluconobacter cerinus TaxID=38307 RepID=UPI00193ED02A|nr:hypothetical protein [Gluconobacter cerinus]MBM3099159.1 hypothetical protein [Gluconobacter cerinus]